MIMCRLQNIDLDPMTVPSIAARERMLDEYARRFVESVEGFDTIKDYCKQASLDMGDKTFGMDLKARIRRLKKTR